VTLGRAMGNRVANSQPRAVRSPPRFIASNAEAPDVADGAPSGDLPRRLLACTTTILRERGVAFVSLRAVAQLAGVSHGAPGYYFKSKAGLLAAYATEGFQHVASLVEAAMAAAGTDPRRRLAAAGHAYIDFALGSPEQFGLMFRREMHGAGDADLERASARLFKLVASTVQSAAKQRLIRIEDADRVAATAWATAHGFATLLIEGRMPARLPTADPALLARRSLDLLVASLLHGDGAPAKKKRPPPKRARPH